MTTPLSWAFLRRTGSSLFRIYVEAKNAGLSSKTAALVYGLLYFRYAARASGVFGAIDRYVEDKKHKKQRRTQRREQEMREELDRILDKVNREGMTALSSAERKFLKETSDRLRE